MTYRVIYSNAFRERIKAHVDYLVSEKVSDQTISNWYERLLLLLDSLDDIPKRHPIDERATEETGLLTRKLNFGDYLIFYTVDDENRVVQVVDFIHGASRK